MLTKNAVLQMGEGEPVWGHFKVGRKVRTLMVEAEHGEDMLVSSLEKIQAKLNYFDGPDHLAFVSQDDRLVLDSKGGMVTLAEHITAFEPDLLVIDPWSEFHRYKDVDNVEQIFLLRSIKSLRPNMALWIIHHDCKTSEFRHAGTSEAMRGSALNQKSDAVVSVKRTNNRVRVIFNKVRYGEATPLDLAYDPDSDTFEAKE